jgi:hypothetical protein
MQSQLKLTRVTQVWRALALTLSASTLTLALCAKPADFRAQSLRATGITVSAAEVRAADAPEPAPHPQLSALAANSDDATLDALIAIAQRGEPKLTSAALEGIAQIGGDRARQFLAHSFSSAPDARLPELASALATLGDAPARAILLSAARSSRPAARGAAFEALTTLDTADVREFMLQALAAVEPIFAAAYFSNCREPRALPALERLAKSGDSEQRRAAIEALFTQGPSAEGPILRLLREDDELCDALLAGQPQTPLLRRALRRASIERLRAGALTTGWVFEFLQRDLSPEAREALVQAARDPASSDSALSALSARGDPGSLRALSALADDADAGLSQRAGCALLSQPDSRSRPFLLRSNRAELKSEAAAALLRINATGARPI